MRNGKENAVRAVKTYYRAFVHIEFTSMDSKPNTIFSQTSAFRRTGERMMATAVPEPAREETKPQVSSLEQISDQAEANKVISETSETLATLSQASTTCSSQPQESVHIKSQNSSNDSLSENGPRRRTPIACVSCHRMKVSCDSMRPCSRCVKMGRSDTCIDRPHKKKGRPPKDGIILRYHVQQDTAIPAMLPDCGLTSLSMIASELSNPKYKSALPDVPAPYSANSSNKRSSPDSSSSAQQPHKQSTGIHLNKRISMQDNEA